jgi:hypothetical protein
MAMTRIKAIRNPTTQAAIRDSVDLLLDGMADLSCLAPPEARRKPARRSAYHGLSA